ncbi:MAG: CU044_2847 family protein [Microcoleaceae cyanobacterium]
MAKNYVQYVTEDGFFLVEVDEKSEICSEEDGVIKAGLDDKVEEVIYSLQMKFEDALDVVNYSARAFAKKIRSLPETPDEMELTFGLKATGKGALVVAQAGVEANFNVKLVWKKSHP